MDAPVRVVAQVDEVIHRFNQRSLDLPDGLFTRHTQLLLNDVPFEAMLGRSPDDPLVLMIARGPAGIRFAAKALQHAVPDAVLERGEIVATAADDRLLLRTACWLSGHYRGTGDAVHDLVDVTLRLTAAGVVERALVALEPAKVERLREARLRQ